MGICLADTPQPTLQVRSHFHFNFDFFGFFRPRSGFLRHFLAVNVIFSDLHMSSRAHRHRSAYRYAERKDWECPRSYLCRIVSTFMCRLGHLSLGKWYWPKLRICALYNSATTQCFGMLNTPLERYFRVLLNDVKRPEKSEKAQMSEARQNAQSSQNFGLVHSITQQPPNASAC